MDGHDQKDLGLPATPDRLQNFSSCKSCFATQPQWPISAPLYSAHAVSLVAIVIMKVATASTDGNDAVSRLSRLQLHKGLALFSYRNGTPYTMATECVKRSELLRLGQNQCTVESNIIEEQDSKDMVSWFLF